MAAHNPDRPPGTRRKPRRPGDYAVGYGKPPPQHQFKTGERNNPLGRKKKDREKWQVDIAELLLEPIQARNQKGRLVEMSFLAANIQLLKVKAAKGDLKAMELLFKTAKEFGLLTVHLMKEPQKLIIELVDPDMERMRLREAAIAEGRPLSPWMEELPPPGSTFL